MKIDGLIEDFAAHLADDPDTSPRTAEFYEADVREFGRFLDERGVEDADALRVGHVMEFRNRLLDGNRKRFTVYRKDAAVRRFLDWARTSTDAELDFDPIEPVHQPLDQQIIVSRRRRGRAAPLLPGRRGATTPGTPPSSG